MKFQKLNGKQIKAWNILITNKYLELLFDGGSRAGKTFVILLFLICLCLKFDGIRILIARLRFAHAKASLWLQTLIPMLHACFNKNDYHIDKQNYIIKIGKSELWLGGLDDKERTDKILGQEYAAVFLNEAVRIAQSTVEKIKTRLAQNIEGFNNFIIYDCNPGNPKHWLRKKFIINKESDTYRLHWLPEDNEVNLPKNYINQILEKLTGHEKRRFRYGEWASLPGQVYHNIKDKNVIKCNQNINYYDDITVGIDFGIYSAVVKWGIKEEKAYCLYEKIILHGKTIDIINALNEIWGLKEKQIIIYCDHEPDRISEIEDAGYYPKKAYKEVGAGDSTVNEYELYFDIDCLNTFQSMLNLLHKQDNNGQFLDAHVKENDHEADASRYALHGWKMDNKYIEYEPFMDIA